MTAKGSKWEATSFCKCTQTPSPTSLSLRGQNAESRVSGVCFGTSYKILHLDFPDNPNKPCLSCTKQWCLNQNLPICAGATLGDADPDTATGKEGDVEARCFRECSCSRSCSGGVSDNCGFLQLCRKGLAPRPACGDHIPVDRVRLAARCRYQRKDGKGGFRTTVQLGGWERAVGGGLTCYG